MKYRPCRPITFILLVLALMFFLGIAATQWGNGNHALLSPLPPALSAHDAEAPLGAPTPCNKAFLFTLSRLGIDATTEETLLDRLSETFLYFFDASLVEMPMSELVNAALETEGPDQWRFVLALALRSEEAVPYVEARLAHGAPVEQYRMARYIRETGQRFHKEALQRLALDGEAHPAARTSALYALASMPLNDATARRLLDEAWTIESGPLRRASLAALAGTDLAGHETAVLALLRHTDPLTRLYAARLLLEQGRDAPLDIPLSLKDDKDPLVRREAYAALGLTETVLARSILEEATQRETHQGALRAARNALRHLDGIENGPLFDNDWERVEWVELLLRRDPPRGANTLATWALEASPPGIRSRLRLLILALTASSRNNIAGLQPFIADTVLYEKHHLPGHAILAREALELCGHSLASATHANAFERGIIEEDRGPRPLNHAHNPLTRRGFIGRRGPGGSAVRYVEALLSRLDRLNARDALTRQDLEAAWYLAGRAHHVFQDMSSPLHVFSGWHVLRVCLFEEYWRDHWETISPIIQVHGLTPTSPPELPIIALDRLDGFTRNRLSQRIGALSDSLPDHVDALAWLAYFRASFWGEIHYDDDAAPPYTTPTRYDDDDAPALPNVLANMFDRNIRYHASWLGDYFEITDRQGNAFLYNRCFLMDDWRPCENPRGKSALDGHLKTGRRTSKRAMRITGRFFFTQKGGHTPLCRPHAYPDGSPMEQTLVYYYGETLFPATVTYGAGWCDSLARRYPRMFEADKAVPRDINRRRVAYIDLFFPAWRKWLPERLRGAEPNSGELVEINELKKRVEENRVVGEVSPAQISPNLPPTPRCGCFPDVACPIEK